MSYKIGEGDYDVRKKRADKFIKNGNRVKLSIQFRGREQQHMSLGDDLIARFIDDLEEAGANIAKTKTIREGRDATTILSQKWRWGHSDSAWEGARGRGRFSTVRSIAAAADRGRPALGVQEHAAGPSRARALPGGGGRAAAGFDEGVLLRRAPRGLSVGAGGLILALRPRRRLRERFSSCHRRCPRPRESGRERRAAAAFDPLDKRTSGGGIRSRPAAAAIVEGD